MHTSPKLPSPRRKGWRPPAVDGCRYMNRPVPDTSVGLVAPAVAYRMPPSVVYRPFPTETVALNLDTGRYHGLDARAAEMLELVTEHSAVPDVAREMAMRHGVDLESASAEVSAFCEHLVSRGLLERL